MASGHPRRLPIDRRLVARAGKRERAAFAELKKSAIGVFVMLVLGGLLALLVVPALKTAREPVFLALGLLLLVSFVVKYHRKLVDRVGEARGSNARGIALVVPVVTSIALVVGFIATGAFSGSESPIRVAVDLLAAVGGWYAIAVLIGHGLVSVLSRTR